MQLGRVCGQVVSTKKAEKLMGFKILVVQPISLDTFEEKGAPFVSLDTVGAGEGEVVMIVGGSSARQTALTDAKPTDSSIVAIIDSVDIEGVRRFDKFAAKPNEGVSQSAPAPEDVPKAEVQKPAEAIPEPSQATAQAAQEPEEEAPELQADEVQKEEAQEDHEPEPEKEAELPGKQDPEKVLDAIEAEINARLSGDTDLKDELKTDLADLTNKPRARHAASRTKKK